LDHLFLAPSFFNSTTPQAHKHPTNIKPNLKPKEKKTTTQCPQGFKDPLNPNSCKHQKTEKMM